MPITIGIDPSLSNCGWAIHDDSLPVGNPGRCLSHGRFQTPSKMEFLVRYTTLRECVRSLIQDKNVRKVSIEYPFPGGSYSEGMWGLFLFVSEALRAEKCDVVFWSPMQIKAHARDSIERPLKWKMEKPDMVEAAATDVGHGRWNHNEADAYLAWVLGARFWKFLDGDLLAGELTPTETKYFTEIHVPKVGKTIKKGLIYRENERFFAWSH